MATSDKLIQNIRIISLKIWSGILYVWKSPFFVSAILLILAVFLTNLLVSQAFQSYFNCDYLFGNLGLGTLCEGVTIKIDVDLLKFHKAFTILPALEVIDGPLEAFRKFIVWDIVIFFALVSLALAFIVNKINGFVKLAMTPAGRKIILTNLSTWLCIYLLLSILFYIAIMK